MMSPTQPIQRNPRKLSGSSSGGGAALDSLVQVEAEMPEGGVGGAVGGDSGPGDVGTIIRPSPVTDKSYVDTMMDLISEVQQMPQRSDKKQVHVKWARFEVADINDPKTFSPEVAGAGAGNVDSPPLLLILGYTEGVQIWLIPVTGEAQELLSWKHGKIKTLRVILKPMPSFGNLDKFADCRPLIATVDATTSKVANFCSLLTGKTVSFNIKNL